MVKQKHVCIIGAGVSGLAAGKAFSERGHQVTIIERGGDLGGVWDPARCYPDVQTQSPKELYRYTDKPMPESYPEWPTGPQVHAYLAGYARDHKLDGAMRFNTTVMSMDRRANGKAGWTLALRGGDGASGREDFDFVAVCTGQFNEPQTLSLPGEEAFKAQGGKILHSSQYNDPAIAKGRKVVVLGGSKSATDIAVNAVNSGAAEVTIVYREPVWRIPYFIGGLVNFKRILYIRAQEEMFQSWGIGAMSRFKHALAKPFVWANWRGLESLLKLQLKLKQCDMVPREPIEDGVNCSVPIATPGFHSMVADGRIKAVRGTFDHYDGKTIVMGGGERVAAIRWRRNSRRRTPTPMRASSHRPQATWRRREPTPAGRPWNAGLKLLGAFLRGVHQCPLRDRTIRRPALAVGSQRRRWPIAPALQPRAERRHRCPAWVHSRRTAADPPG